MLLYVPVFDFSKLRQLRNHVNVITDEFNEVTESKPRLTQNRLEPFERDVYLFFDSFGYHAVRTDTDLTGDKQQSAGAHRRGIIKCFKHLGAAKDRMGIRKCHCFFVLVHYIFR